MLSATNVHKLSGNNYDLKNSKTIFVLQLHIFVNQFQGPLKNPRYFIPIIAFG